MMATFQRCDRCKKSNESQGNTFEFVGTFQVVCTDIHGRHSEREVHLCKACDGKMSNAVCHAIANCLTEEKT
jgi:hypothetical protein